MKPLTTILVTSVLAIGVAACNRATSPASPTITTAANAAAARNIQSAAIKNPFFAFTKVPAAFAEQRITAGPDVQLMVFDVNAIEAKETALTELAFMIPVFDTTTFLPAPAGYVTNFRLIYYPKGLGSAGTLIAANDGLAWTPGFTPATFLRLALSPAFAFKQNFKGTFALIADLSPSPMRFQPSLQTANAIIGGVDQTMLSQTCDLPLRGDSFIVN